MQRNYKIRVVEAGSRGKIKPGVKKKRKILPSPTQPGERRSVSIFLRRRKKECFTAQRALEKSKETRGEKRGRRFEKIIFLSPSHTLSIPLAPHSLTHAHTLSPSPLSSPLLMAIKGAENNKKKGPTTTNFKPAQSMSH
ncbi:N-acylneuraminate cytidylyltransferase [Platysternon megacephalum]|uniref:N-acylneuraminate cytidylyltransferase n=1 Tax=Platysternon megacephalum TaxID=55544 RepID=A0A4D9DY59_9SAUR|nr:N-acylneuraminate cytidylyltransferase [Platysternon megacephalum]